MESHFFILKFIAILYSPGDGVDYIYKVVALLVDYVHALAGRVELGVYAGGHHLVHEVWVGLIADFEYVLFVDEPEPCMGGLEVVECVPHVSFCGEGEGFQA